MNVMIRILVAVLLAGLAGSAAGVHAARPAATAEDSLRSVRKPFYMEVKTNLLHDALAVPDIGVEFYIDKGFSVGAEFMYAWWRNESRHRMWRIYGGEVACRYWFGRAASNKPLTGHHAGIYAGLYTFCFEWGTKGYLGGLPGNNLWDRPWVNAGLEYGYSLPLTSRLNMDFTIGVGYFGGKLEKYTPQGDLHIWKSTSRYAWIGPTKAGVSLVWLLGYGNCNIKKHK